MAPSKKVVASLVALLVLDNKEKQEKVKKKKKSCKNWLLHRHLYSHVNLLNELRVYEPADFKNYLRMDDDAFRTILELIRPKITKQNTVMRNAISAEERLTFTLRYLATGNSYEDLKFSTAISPQSLSAIIPETCWAIYDALKKDYLKVRKNDSILNIVTL
jgi:hypothetical protein